MIWDITNKQQRKYVPYVRVVLLDGSELRDVIRIDTATGDVTRLKRNVHGCTYVQHHDDGCAIAKETITCPGVRVEPKANAPGFIKEEWPR